MDCPPLNFCRAAGETRTPDRLMKRKLFRLQSRNFIAYITLAAHNVSIVQLRFLVSLQLDDFYSGHDTLSTEKGSLTRKRPVAITERNDVPGHVLHENN